MIREKIIGYLTAVLLIFCSASVFFAKKTGIKTENRLMSADKIGLIKIYGLISVMPSRGTDFIGLRGSDKWVEQLKFMRDADVKAVVLRINSPGGTIGACQEIVEEIDRLKKEGIPVVASLGDVGASGGYYIASACDKIYLDKGTLTGSIGVVMDSTDWSELMKKVGVRPQVIKSGKYKDMGAFYRRMTDEEKNMIQNMIDDTYEQFLGAVSKGRRIPEEKLRPLAQGQVFTGEQAIKYGLADKIGNMNSAIRAAADMSGIKGKPRIIESPGPFEKLLNVVSGAPESLAEALKNTW